MKLNIKYLHPLQLTLRFPPKALQRFRFGASRGHPGPRELARGGRADWDYAWHGAISIYYLSFFIHQFLKSGLKKMVFLNVGSCFCWSSTSDLEKLTNQHRPNAVSGALSGFAGTRSDARETGAGVGLAPARC